MRAAIERFFRLGEHGTTLRTEALGGATTFATMAYIVVVNPAILSFAGLPVGPSTVATILVAVVGCLLMGLYANLHAFEEFDASDPREVKKVNKKAIQLREAIKDFISRASGGHDASNADPRALPSPGRAV